MFTTMIPKTAYTPDVLNVETKLLARSPTGTLNSIPPDAAADKMAVITVAQNPADFGSKLLFVLLALIIAIF